MTAPLLVWDQKTCPPDQAGEVLYWQTFAEVNGVSVPRYLENHAEHFRAKYLAFIHDLGESRTGDGSLVEHLALSDGFSFWWLTRLAEKSPFKSPRIYSCLRLMVLEEILLDRRPSELKLFSSDPNLAKAVQMLCLNLQIGFEWRDAERIKEKWSLHGIYHTLPYPVQGLIYFVRNLFERWPIRGFEKPRWFSGSGAIFLCSFFAHLDAVTCEQGVFHSRLWGVLPERLHDSGRRTNWVHHFLRGAEVPDTRSGLNWLRCFNADANRQGLHIFLESYLSWGVVGRAFKNWLWLNVVSWRLGNIPSASFAYLWPMLRDDWQTSLAGPVAANNCLWVELFDAALQDIPPQKIGLYICENQAWERALLRAWRKHGHGLIIGVAHATVPFWHLYYFDDPRNLDSKCSSAMPQPDRLAVNGPPAWKLLAEEGYPIERLVEVEALRYLNLSRTLSRHISDPARMRILILGDAIPSSMRSLLSNLSGSMKCLPPGWRFTFKPHPILSVELADYRGLENVGRTSEALDRIIGEYDVALAANSTSAAVDAYQAGLPVVIGLDGSDLNLSPLRGQPGARFVGTAEELTDALLAAGKDAGANRERAEFFFLDPELPRWRLLLS